MNFGFTGRLVLNVSRAGSGRGQAWIVRRRRRRQLWLCGIEKSISNICKILSDRHCGRPVKSFISGGRDEKCAMVETCQAWLRRAQLATKGIHWQYLDEAFVQQLAGIKYSPVAQDHHRPLKASQQLGKALTVGPLDVNVHPHPHAAHHGLHVVRHLHLLAALGLPGP